MKKTGSSNNTTSDTNNQSSQDSGQNIPSPSEGSSDDNPWRGETIMKSDKGESQSQKPEIKIDWQQE